MFCIFVCSRKAFKGLAYSRFQRVPLYLEWAPEGAMDRTTARKQGSDISAAAAVAEKKEGGVSKGESGKAAAPGAVAVVGEREGGEGTVMQGNTVYVKNLNFETTEAALKKLFEKVRGMGGVASVRARSVIMRQRAPGVSQLPDSDWPLTLARGVCVTMYDVRV